jgi:hypothetical protein
MFRCYACGNEVGDKPSYCSDCKDHTGGEHFEPTSNKLTFEFETIEDADQFKSWMCNQGEQSFYVYDEKTKEEIYYSFFYHIKGGNTVKVFK